MMPSSPLINPLPAPSPINLPPPSSPSSSSTTHISLNSLRFQPQASKIRHRLKMIGTVIVGDDLGIRYDSRSNPSLRPNHAPSGFLISDSNQFQEEIPAMIRSPIEKDFMPVQVQKRSNCNYKRMIEDRDGVDHKSLTRPVGKAVSTRLFTHSNRRRSIWAEMKIAIDETASASEKMMLTWVINSVKLLLSLTLWKSMFRLINMLLLILLLPFNGTRRNCVVLEVKRVDKKEKQKGIEIIKEDRHGHVPVGSGKGPVKKLPTADPLPHPLALEVLVRREMAIQRVREDKDDIDKTSREYKLFVTPRGVTLFTQSWTPVSATIKGLVVLLHGLNEHSGRYSSFAKQLTANGYKVYGLDWIGHGGSDGLHGYVHSLDDAVSDAKVFLDEVLTQNPGTPCFCFGHSTGGSILLKAALDPKVEAKIKGLILTSPAIGVQASHPIYTILAPIISILVPRYQCGAANKKGAVVSRDPEALATKYSDPLVFTGSLRVRTGYEILRISRCLQKNLRRLRVPFMVLHGTADVITDPKASKKLHAEASSTDKTIRLYEGLLHDLLFEPEREKIIHDIMEWLIERT